MPAFRRSSFTRMAAFGQKQPFLADEIVRSTSGQEADLLVPESAANCGHNLLEAYTYDLVDFIVQSFLTKGVKSVEFAFARCCAPIGRC